MAGTPPAHEIAAEIFAAAGDDSGSVDRSIATLRRICTTFTEAMSPLIGDAGCRAIFFRGLTKAKRAHPVLGDVVLADAETFLEPLLIRLRAEEPAEIRAAGITLFTHFIELIANLIGDELAVKFLRRAWPGTALGGRDRVERP